MKLVIYPSCFRDLDGRKLVVKTVNKLPQAEHFLVLEQSLDLALDGSCIGVSVLPLCKFLCTIPSSTCSWKGRYDRNLVMFYPWGL
jgi:hypothetical protein